MLTSAHNTYEFFNLNVFLRNVYYVFVTSRILNSSCVTCSKQKKSQESKQNRVSAKKKPVNTSKIKSQKINRNTKSIFGVLDNNKKHNKHEEGR